VSCGNHHDVDCDEVLRKVYSFIDNELEGASLDEIRQHLDECAPCLEQFDLERSLKKLVHRSCTGEHAPEGLRERILMRITKVHVEYRTQD
jgi:mycothiol system anti-sigma-R factor